MYPTSPTVEQWRLAAAKMAKANGVPVPDYYDGTMAGIQRLNTDGKTDINAAITWMQNAYVVQNPGLFPPANLDYSKNFLAKNPSSSAWAGGFAQVENGVLSQVVDFGKAVIVDPILHPVDTFNSTVSGWKNILGIDEVKKDPGGFAKVAVVGIAIGAGLWYFFGRKEGK